MFGKRLLLFIFTPVVMAGGGTPLIQQGYVLSSESPIIEYKVSVKDQVVQKNKYLQVVISSVINPGLEPLIFSVYRRLYDKQEFLGTFSLFPPDNPGRFIVPTQGKVADGDLIIIMVKGVEEKKTGSTIKVYVDSVEVVDGLD